MVAEVEACTYQLMGRISGNALQRIDAIQERDRRRVHAYYSFLCVWHRLDEARWEQSRVQLQTGRKRAKKPEVDHTVADRLWARLVDHEIKAKQAEFSGADEERERLAPDEFESQDDARAFVNLLGNCSLLEKSFNISANVELHGKTSTNSSKKAIQMRDVAIRKDLAEFIAGSKHRVD